jgi:hypothetical protein
VEPFGFIRSDHQRLPTVASAVRAIESAGLQVLRVPDKDLLTLADITDRMGRRTGERPALRNR